MGREKKGSAICVQIAGEQKQNHKELRWYTQKPKGWLMKWDNNLAHHFRRRWRRMEREREKEKTGQENETYKKGTAKLVYPLLCLLARLGIWGARSIVVNMNFSPRIMSTQKQDGLDPSAKPASQPGREMSSFVPIRTECWFYGASRQMSNGGGGDKIRPLRMLLIQQNCLCWIKNSRRVFGLSGQIGSPTSRGLHYHCNEIRLRSCLFNSLFFLPMACPIYLRGFNFTLIEDIRKMDKFLYFFIFLLNTVHSRSPTCPQSASKRES